MENIEHIIQKIGIKTKNYWIHMLKTLPQIGVVKVSGKLLEQPYLDQLCQELAYMANKTGIVLPVVIGGGKQYQKLEFYNKCKKINGQQVTPKPLIDEMAVLAKNLQNKATKELSKFTQAKAMKLDVMTVEPDWFEETENGLEYKGYVGKIVDVNTEHILEILNNGQIPVISHMTYCHNYKNFYNVNATTMAKAIAQHLGSKKLILIGDKPVNDNNGNIISEITCESELNQLVKNGVIIDGMGLNVKEAFEALKLMGYGSSVHITALQNNGDCSTGLLEELLGDGGGTKITLPIPISSFPLSMVDKNKLHMLIDEVFEKYGLMLVDNYMDMIKTNNATVYLDPLHKGGAVTYAKDGYEYMCKLITHPNYEGLGIASNIIDTIVSQKGKVGWRTSQEYPKKMYQEIIEKHNGTMVQKGNYSIYLIGVVDIESTAQEISKIPPTLKPIEGSE